MSHRVMLRQDNQKLRHADQASTKIVEGLESTVNEASNLYCYYPSSPPRWRSAKGVTRSLTDPRRMCCGGHRLPCITTVNSLGCCSYSLNPCSLRSIRFGTVLDISKIGIQSAIREEADGNTLPSVIVDHDAVGAVPIDTNTRGPTLQSFRTHLFERNKKAMWRLIHMAYRNCV